jgi:hypothetical protein
MFDLVHPAPEPRANTIAITHADAHADTFAHAYADTVACTYAVTDSFARATAGRRLVHGERPDLPGLRPRRVVQRRLCELQPVRRERDSKRRGYSHQWWTNESGSAVVYLDGPPPGTEITVIVDGATCYTSD